MEKAWKYRITVCFALIIVSFSLWAQPAIVDSGRHLFRISAISISGNNKTKDFVVKRELPFKEGDSVALTSMVEKFRVGKQQLVNTRLFNEVIISIKSFMGYDVVVQVDLKERWYIFPIPYLKPVDRNLQAWASKGYSLSRVNFGAKFTYYNTTGRNDRLRLWLITGYSRQIQASYDQPYAGKDLKRGYGFNFIYAAQKEVNLMTINNTQVFLKADSVPKAGKFLQENWIGFIQYTYRPALKTRHLIRLGYNYTKVDSVVIQLNPTYLTNTRKTQVSYPEITYAVSYVNVDYAAYPQRGLMGDITLTKTGFTKDMDLWTLGLRGVKAWDLKWKSSYSLQVNGVLRVPFEQPFLNQRLFGYGDFYLRGLEKYVVDGVAGVIARNTVRRQLFDFNFNLPPSRIRHDRIPFKFYAKAYSDFGYSYHHGYPENSLSNKFLYTAGAGIDVVTLYDFVFRFEYSFNQLGQQGVFFHFKNDF